MGCDAVASSFRFSEGSLLRHLQGQAVHVLGQSVFDSEDKGITVLRSSGSCSRNSAASHPRTVVNLTLHEFPIFHLDAFSCIFIPALQSALLSPQCSLCEQRDGLPFVTASYIGMFQHSVLQ